MLCNDCHEYAEQAQILKRFNFSGNLKEQYSQLENLVIRLYFDEKVGVTEIWKRTGISYRTVKRILDSKGLRTRTLSEGVSLGLEKGRVKLPCPSEERYRYKSGKHISWEGKEFWLRSSYEFRFAKELDTKHIPYEVEPFKIKYFDTQLQKQRLAIPDFYLSSTKTLVEVKSLGTYDKQNMKDRFEAYKKEGYTPVLVLEGQEVEI